MYYDYNLSFCRANNKKKQQKLWSVGIKGVAGDCTKTSEAGRGPVLSPLTHI